MSARPRCHKCDHPKGPQHGCAGAAICRQDHRRHTNKPPCACECHAAERARVQGVGR